MKQSMGATINGQLHRNYKVIYSWWWWWWW
jgi:hypothetical protein